MKSSTKRSCDISVIIPAYNYGHFIGACIESVLRQGIDSCEIIVIDDGSTDDTPKRLKPYADKIRYVYQSNRGLSAARNAGIALANGSYIQFLDADDLLGTDALAGRLAFLQANASCSIAVCRNLMFTGDDIRGRPQDRLPWRLFQSHLAVHLCHLNIAPPHAFLSRREVITQIGDFDESLRACEDYDFWIRAVTLRHVPAYCHSGVVHYRVHANSMSANRALQVQHDAILALRLFDHLYVQRDYPIDDPVATDLAYLSGLTLTVTRLKALGVGKGLVNELQDRMNRVFDKCFELFAHIHRADNFTTRLYYHLCAELLAQNPTLFAVLRNGKRVSENLATIQSPAYLVATLIDAITTTGEERTTAVVLANHILNDALFRVRRKLSAIRHKFPSQVGRQ